MHHGFTIIYLPVLNLLNLLVPGSTIIATHRRAVRADRAAADGLTREPQVNLAPYGEFAT